MSNLYSVQFTVDVLRHMGEGTRADSLAGRWVEVLQQRRWQYPDNHRIQGFSATLASRLGMPEGIRSLQEIRNSPSIGVRSIRVVGIFHNAKNSTSQLRRELPDLWRADSTFGYIVLQSGIARLGMGAQYHELQASPEFQAYESAIQRRHDQLAARY